MTENGLLLPYIGVPTFLRAPLRRRSGYSAADICFLGIPYDGGSSNRPGARYGPRALREASLIYAYQAGNDPGLQFFDAEKRDSLSPTIGLVDRDDVCVNPGNYSATERLISQEAALIINNGALPLVAGGDHSISYSIVKAYTQPIRIIHFDAHTDYMDMGFSEVCCHGTVMRRISNLPNVEAIIHCGIRGLLNSKHGMSETLDDGNTVITAEELAHDGAGMLREHIEPSDVNYYISFDCDCLDPSVAPGTGTPEPGGLSYRTASNLLRLLASECNIVGMDIVELNPLFDTHNITSQIMARLSIDFLISWKNRHAHSIY